MSIFLAFLVQTATLATPPLFELPRKFWGEYNEVLADCGADNNISRLRISRNRIQFYESIGELEEVLHQPDGSLVIVATHSGEGQTWQSVYQMRLSEDNQTLTVTHPQSAEMEQFSTDRHRCASNQTK